MEEIIQNSIGIRLKEVLDKLKLYKKISGDKEIADKIGSKHVSSVTEMKKGRQTVSIKLLTVLQNDYNINTEYILQGKGEMFLPVVPVDPPSKEEVDSGPAPPKGVPPDITDKTTIQAVVSIAESNKILAQSNADISASNKVLAETNKQLADRVLKEPANDSRQTKQVFDPRFGVLQELLLDALVEGKRYSSRDEAEARIHKILSDIPTNVSS